MEVSHIQINFSDMKENTKYILYAYFGGFLAISGGHFAYLMCSVAKSVELYYQQHF